MSLDIKQDKTFADYAPALEDKKPVTEVAPTHLIMPAFDFPDVQLRNAFEKSGAKFENLQAGPIVFGGWKLYINPVDILHVHVPLISGMLYHNSWVSGELYKLCDARDVLILLGGVRHMPVEENKTRPCFVAWGDAAGRPKAILNRKDHVTYHVGEKGRMVIVSDRIERAAGPEHRVDMFTYELHESFNRTMLWVRPCDRGADGKRWAGLIAKAKAGYDKHCIK